MIISHELKYVYIGIPRTASKSMSEWLVKHYSGEWFGYHHQWQVPQVATNYLRFTIVRNPYERSASMMFGELWGEEKPDPAKRVPSRKPEPPENYWMKGYEKQSIWETPQFLMINPVSLKQV